MKSGDDTVQCQGSSMGPLVWKRVGSALVVALLALGVAQAAPKAVVSANSPPAYLPAMTLPDMGGRRVSLKSLEGRVLVVNVWANWCPFCHKEAPGLVQLHRKLRGHVRFVGIAIGGPRSARRFVAQQKIPYLTLLARPHPSQVLAALGDKRGLLPYTLLVLPNGRIVSTHVGYDSKARLRRAIARIRSARP